MQLHDWQIRSAVLNTITRMVFDENNQIVRSFASISHKKVPYKLSYIYKNRNIQLLWIEQNRPDLIILQMVERYI